MANVGKSTLGCKSAHRKRLLIHGSNALIKHKSIFTTKVKAKMIARYLAPIITKARKYVERDFLHAKRRASSLLGDKKSVQMLFNDILPKIGDRRGGYTRIITLENRPGDDKTRVLLELVDYNALYTREVKTKTTRRSRKKNKHDLEIADLNKQAKKTEKNMTNTKEKLLNQEQKNTSQVKKSEQHRS
ncbi:MAG: 50S ribosomal protein L17 [Bacteroidota bacterium]